MEREFELYGHGFQRDPHTVYDKMRAQAPIVRDIGYDGSTPIWFVVGYDEAVAVLKDNETFSRDFTPLWGNEFDSDPVFQLMNAHMLNRDGDVHRRLRSLVSKAFTPRIVKQLRPQIEANAHALIDAIEANGEADLMEAYAFPLPVKMISDMLGVPAADSGLVRDFTNFALLPEDQIEGGQEAAMEKFMQFSGYMRQLVASRKANPQDDMISALVQVEAEGDKLTEPELYSNIVLLIIAGFETTVSLIGNGTAAILQHPDLFARLKADPALMPQTIEELLRYEGSVERALTRWVTQDVEMAGASMKRGDLIVVALNAANHDSEHFGCPHQLDIERTQNKHLSFGHGAHYCLGAPLARAEGEIAFNVLFSRLPNLELAIDPADFTWFPSPGFRRLTTLPVRW